MEFDDVATLAADLPETTVSTSYGTPALKVREKLPGGTRWPPRR